MAVPVYRATGRKCIIGAGEGSREYDLFIIRPLRPLIRPLRPLYTVHTATKASWTSGAHHGHWQWPNKHHTSVQELSPSQVTANSVRVLCGETPRGELFPLALTVTPCSSRPFAGAHVGRCAVVIARGGRSRWAGYRGATRRLSTRRTREETRACGARRVGGCAASTRREILKSPTRLESSELSGDCEMTTVA